MSDKIKYREFIRNTSKYIKPGANLLVQAKDRLYSITVLEVVGELPKEQFRANLKVKGHRRTEAVHLSKEDHGRQVFGGKYACGCKVVEKKKLCPKHGRA